MKQDRKELLIFLAVTYGLPLLMAFPMAVLFYQGKDVFSFPSAQMFYPAAGLMAAKLLCEKDNPLLPRRFFLVFLALTGLMILWCLSGFFLSGEAAAAGSSYTVMGALLLLFSFYFSEEKEKRRACRLCAKNWGASIALLGLFLALCWATLAAERLLGESESVFGSLTPQMLLSMPIAVAASLPCFFGEEYGWRTYFQPLLQQRFGRIRGVLLFGFVWEFWHLPLVFFYYTPVSGMTLAQILVLRYSFVPTIAIFMAFAYMKTGNLWLPVLLHGCNNFWYSPEPDAVPTPATWGQVGLAILLRLLCFLPLLLSPVFRGEGTLYGPEENGEQAALP